MNRIISLSILLMLAGCSSAENDALVSLFEYRQSNARETTCLSVFGNDPSAELLTRIHRHDANVVPSSECIQKPYGGYLYKGQNVLYKMKIEKSSWLGPRKISFEVAYVTGGTFGSSGELIVVEKLNEFWVLTKREMTWIS